MTTKTQRTIIVGSGHDASEFYRTSAGWSHNGFVAWQLEAADNLVSEVKQ